ncbi:MAG TPA: hypothetical protein PLN63_08480 [Paludibacteraceae bacterium]|nr:hypothetical protein [Paludibacteraceae bacterium]
MDKNWLDNLLKFFPKSMFNVEKMWDNEWKSYAIIVCDDYRFPDKTYEIFYYDTQNNHYNMSILMPDRKGGVGGTFREDLYDLDFACAAFIYRVRRTYDKEYKKIIGESFESWDERRYKWAENLWQNISKYFKIKEEDRDHLYRYGGIYGKEDFIPLNGKHCHMENLELVEVLQQIDQNK